MILSTNAANPIWNQALNAPFQPNSWSAGGGGYAGYDGTVNVRYGDSLINFNITPGQPTQPWYDHSGETSIAISAPPGSFHNPAGPTVATPQQDNGSLLIGIGLAIGAAWLLFK